MQTSWQIKRTLRKKKRRKAAIQEKDWSQSPAVRIRNADDTSKAVWDGFTARSKKNGRVHSLTVR